MLVVVAVDLKAEPHRLVVVLGAITRTAQAERQTLVEAEAEQMVPLELVVTVVLV
jgi:hypothetical protein